MCDEMNEWNEKNSILYIVRIGSRSFSPYRGALMHFISFSFFEHVLPIRGKLKAFETLQNETKRA